MGESEYICRQIPIRKHGGHYVLSQKKTWGKKIKIRNCFCKYAIENNQVA